MKAQVLKVDCPGILLASGLLDGLATRRTAHGARRRLPRRPYDAVCRLRGPRSPLRAFGDKANAASPIRSSTPVPPAAPGSRLMAPLVARCQLPGPDLVPVRRPSVLPAGDSSPALPARAGARDLPPRRPPNPRCRRCGVGEDGGGWIDRG